jgi:dolichyl-diphosphooligosaccharide--protein glycosyltransferase
MSRTRIEITACAVILMLIFLASLSLRIGIPWSHVFVRQWVKFTDNDAYFYMRLLDNLSDHFPSLGSFDPYFIYPAGKDLANQPLFMVYFMGFFAWLFGGGSPSQHIVDLVAVFSPAVLGALLVFPIFFIGRAIFNKWAGLIAAAFAALIPGEFLIRTLLGFTSTHAFEIFLSTLFMLFIMLSIKTGKLITFPPSVVGGLRQHIIPLVYGAAAGISLGLYLLAWAGALLFVFISFVWLVVQVIVDHAHGRPTLYLLVTGFTAYLLALLISLASPATAIARIPLIIAIIVSLILPAVSLFMQRRGFKPASYYVFIASAAVIATLVLLVIGPQLIGSLFSTLTGFFTWNTALSIAEEQPLLIQQGSFTLALLWGNYTSASILALVAFVFVAYRAFKKGEPEMVALLIWSFISLLAALAMRRFAYYLAINVSLLAGYCGWLILGLFGIKGAASEASSATIASKGPAKVQGKGKRAATREKRLTTKNRILAAIGIAVVAALAIYPNTGPLPGGDKPFFDVATMGLSAPSDAWCESLDWLRKNSPEPFGDANYYYAYTAAPGNAPGYSVVCWWDFGYWVSRIAHRVPFSNSGSAALGEQYYFISQDSKAADNISSKWGMKYVIVDDYTVNWNKGFGAIAYIAGQPESRYCEIYYRRQNDTMIPTLLYYPDYYNTMAVRLYCFEGNKYTPQETAVISWEDRQNPDGQQYKEITGIKTFGSYSEASDFIASQQSGNWRIVGKDPTVSPVPLDRLNGYRLAYASSQKSKVGTADTSSVKIFEYSQDNLSHE